MGNDIEEKMSAVSDSLKMGGFGDRLERIVREARLPASDGVMKDAAEPELPIDGLFSDLFGNGLFGTEGSTCGAGTGLFGMENGVSRPDAGLFGGAGGICGPGAGLFGADNGACGADGGTLGLEKGN